MAREDDVDDDNVSFSEGWNLFWLIEIIEIEGICFSWLDYKILTKLTI
jgi:hypothetical protein